MEKRIRLDNREIYRTCGALLGALLYALGINLFIVPIGIYSSGLMGVCQVIRTVLVEYAGLNFGSFDFAGLIYYLINIPLFFLAWKTMGRLFFFKTMLCIAAMTPSSPSSPSRQSRLCQRPAHHAPPAASSRQRRGRHAHDGRSTGGWTSSGSTSSKAAAGVSGDVSLTINAVLYAVLAV